MSRLIDADVLVKIIDKHTNDENQLDDDITCILEEVQTLDEKEITRKVFDRVFKRMNAISYREESNDCNTFGDVPHYVVSLPAIKQILKEEIDINERD